jgi:predicted acyl esterase
MSIDSGPRDQRPVQMLPNYGLSYPQVLEEDLRIAGSVNITLHIQSKCPDTDFVAKLIELHADGRAMLLIDGVVRAMYRDAAAGPQHLAPDQVYALTIHLDDIHHTFTAGAACNWISPAAIFPAVSAIQTAAARFWQTTPQRTSRSLLMRSIIANDNHRSSCSLCCLSRHGNPGEPDTCASTRPPNQNSDRIWNEVGEQPG